MKNQFTGIYHIGNVSWSISSCSLHETVSIQYCEEKCGMKEHCKVFLESQKTKFKEKVRFD